MVGEKICKVSIIREGTENVGVTKTIEEWTGQLVPCEPSQSCIHAAFRPETSQCLHNIYLCDAQKFLLQLQ